MWVQLLTLIAGFESFHGIPYKDHKQFSVGYGTKATEEICVTKQHALQQLSLNVAIHLKNVDRANLTDGQVVALTSFSYNVGVNAYKNSKVAKLVKQGRMCEAARELKTWVKAGGKVNNGLIKRRAVEGSLLTKGITC